MKSKGGMTNETENPSRTKTSGIIVTLTRVIDLHSVVWRTMFWEVFFPLYFAPLKKLLFLMWFYDFILEALNYIETDIRLLPRIKMPCCFLGLPRGSSLKCLL